ncbi:MAG: PAS domain-containing protein [Sulfurospirillum sp.]|nr:PAS domain-containing protein [Sulfurospirillum sp.]
MRFIVISILLLIQLFADTPKEILLLHSYNKGLKWSDGISDGVLSVVKNYPEYELTTEYMDSKKINTQAYFTSLLDLYQKKFTNRKYAAIITADNYAFSFALKYHDLLFKDTPIIFCGIENFENIEIPQDKQQFVTGVIEYKEIDKNLKLIKKIAPHVSTLYILSDDSLSSLAIKKQILDAIKPYQKELDIIYDNNISLNELEKKVAALPTKSAVLFTSFYKDKYANYVPYNALRKLFKNAPYPIFALNSIHLGEGILGGYMISPIEQGSLAAQKVFQILHEEKKPNQIAISQPPATVSFDFEVMQKFSITQDDLPSEVNIINKPADFFERNRKIIDSVFVLMPLLIALILGLIINISKRVCLEVRLIEQSKLDSVLLNNIQSAIFWKSNNGYLLGCNDTLCTLLEKNKEELLGKQIKKILPEICEKCDNDSFVQELETTLVKTAKEPIYAMIRQKQYLNKNNEIAGVIIIITDITEYKKLQNQRKKEEQFLIQRSKLSEIGEMITSIAHQWKSPLVEISAIAQELFYKKKKGAMTQDVVGTFVDDIMAQVTYMSNTIDDFRAFLKPSTKKTIFDIHSAVLQILSIIEHNLKYNYIEVNLICHDNHTFVYGYPNEFKQSILNIINNAKDSILQKKSFELIEGKIDLEITCEDDLVCITIKDNGIGIKKKHLEKVFEPFYTEKKDGDGFGLYMARMIIEEKMQGKIQAKFIENGACFSICMPKKEQNEDFTA